MLVIQESMYVNRGTMLKAICSFVQAVLNYQRKSTSGWQIWNILLDFTGGSLSVVQLIGDSIAEARAQGLQSGWRGIVGNPAKLVLGLVSIFFDVRSQSVTSFIIRILYYGLRTLLRSLASHRSSSLCSIISSIRTKTNNARVRIICWIIKSRI